MIKVIFFDIDGTLLSFKTRRVPESTIRAIEILREKGIKIFIATGRAKYQIERLDGIHFDGYITLNGGYCETDEREVFYKKKIAKEEVQNLIEYQKEHPFACTFSTEDELFINFHNELVDQIYGVVEMPPIPQKDITEALNHDIYQMTAFITQEEENKLLNEVLHNCDAARWHPVFTDIVAKGTSKQDGIDRVLEYYGFDLSEAMCFGDGGNDISMLQHTPISVAMGNASDEVKQHATYITDSVDDDGVWNALKHFGLI